MRSRMGIIVVTLFAAMALSAIAVGSASADEWFIGGTKLTQLPGQSAALATTAPVDEPAILKVNPGTEEVQIKCTGANLVGGEAYISGTNGGMAKSLTFEQCGVVKAAVPCELEPQSVGGTKNLRNIPTNPLGVTTSLVASTKIATKVSINIHPLTKKTFVEIPFAEGSTCLGGPGLHAVNGSVLILSSDGFNEQAVHTIQAQGSLENNSLETAGLKSFIEGGLALVKLASGSKWSFHA
jgi:hypothetical protein